MGEALVYEYELSFQDYSKAQILFRRHCRSARLRMILWLAITLGLVVVDIYFRYRDPAQIYDPLLAPTFFFVFMSVWVVGLRPWHLRRGYKELLPPGEKEFIPAEFSFDEHAVVSSIPGKSETRIFWPGILDYAEDGEVALIFVRRRKFLFVPKRAMDEAAWASLRAYIQQHGIGKKLAH